MGADTLDKEKIHLERRPEGLTLTDGDLEICPDFVHLLGRLRRDNLSHELLVKAARLKGLPAEYTPTLLDATAGFGEDSLLLAAAGFQVTLCEQDEVIAALLEDAMQRAAEHPDLKDIVCRMRLYKGDSIAYMKEHAAEQRFDVVLLDPMFPERQKSALVKKKFQLIHYLEHPCSEEKELLEAALALHPRRIVIKRPLKGPFLAGRKPSYSLKGKAVRVDVIVGN